MTISSNQYVTLVVQGGAPVRLANQVGAPYPTTGQGALVFSNGATMTDSTFVNPTFSGTIVLPATGPAGGDLAGNYPNPTIKTSVGLTGIPTAPTAIAGTSTTQLATTAYVAQAMGRTSTTTIRHVTNRVFIPNTAITDTGVFTRSWQMSYVPLTALKIVLPNWYVNNSLVETSLGGATTWQAWVEYPLGVYTRLTFGGATSITTGAMINIYSDTVQLPTAIPQFTKFWLWIAKSNTSGGGLTSYTGSSAMRDYANGDLQQGNTTSFVPGIITDDGNPFRLSCPLAVMGLSNQHVWCVLGESNVIGANESSNDTLGGRGWFGRALSRMGPQMNMGVGGDSGTQYLVSHAMRHDLITQAGATRLILQYAGNDIFNGLSSGAVLAIRAQIRALYANMPIFETTVIPVTNSTDLWKTAANQTLFNPTADGSRVAFNDAMRHAVTGVTGVIDVAAVMETKTTYEQAPYLNGGVYLPYMVDESTGFYHSSSQGNSSAALQERIFSTLMLAGP